MAKYEIDGALAYTVAVAESWAGVDWVGYEQIQGVAHGVYALRIVGVLIYALSNKMSKVHTLQWKYALLIECSSGIGIILRNDTYY